MQEAPKRRILYIRHKRKVEITDGFRLNQDEWVEALSEVADVTLLNSDFDMDEVCDRVQPDFIVYESSFFYPAPLTIQNVRSHPHIPRIGFQMQDPYCSIRVNFMRTMDAMGIDWMFTHMTEMALNQSPELKACTFSAPLLFDERVFYDYGLEKDIPVSVMGGFLLPEMYNWRAVTAKVLPDIFPTLIYTHPGYNNPVPRHKFPVAGVEYARILNRSHFSLADSTIFDCLVRKHLEIPAAGAVLIAPDASVLKPYGFKDMENCILGEGQELFDKMAAVADDPERYETIRKNGYDLVHNKYARKHWRCFLDFFECLRSLKPGETIRQQGLLGGFVAVPADTAPPSAIIADYPDNEISALMKKWLAVIVDPAGATKENLEKMETPDWIGHIHEPSVLMGVIALLRGDVTQAEKLFASPQFLRTKQSSFNEYDPEEIAWLSLAASLSGNAELLEKTRRESATMRHVSLRRMQWLGNVLANGGDVSHPPRDVLMRAKNDHYSIHWTSQMNIREWLGVINRILAAHGHSGLLKNIP